MKGTSDMNNEDFQDLKKEVYDNAVEKGKDDAKYGWFATLVSDALFTPLNVMIELGEAAGNVTAGMTEKQVEALREAKEQGREDGYKAGLAEED